MRYCSLNYLPQNSVTSNSHYDYSDVFTPDGEWVFWAALGLVTLQTSGAAGLRVFHLLGPAGWPVFSCVEDGGLFRLGLRMGTLSLLSTLMDQSKSCNQARSKGWEGALCPAWVKAVVWIHMGVRNWGHSADHRWEWIVFEHLLVARQLLGAFHLCT